MSPALTYAHSEPGPVPPRAPRPALDVLREVANRCPAATAQDCAVVLGGRDPLGVVRGYAAGSPERSSGTTEKQ